MGMDPVTAGMIGSTVIGGVMGNKSAKADRRAQADANRMSSMPYMDARPYLNDVYSRGQNALDAAVNTGAYTGQTYAGIDPFQAQAAQQLGSAGQLGYADALNFMGAGRGFANNYQDIYNMANRDQLAAATDYARNNVEPLLAVAMRDPYRALTEQTLPGIDRMASGSGNMNSSRAGVADALAQRAYDDRSADTAVSLLDQLTNRGLQSQTNQFNMMNSANANLGNMYNAALGQAGTSAGFMNQGGGILSTDAQNRLNDEKARFEAQRDFEMQQLNNYNTGILGGRGGNSLSGINAVTANPFMGTMGGAMMGAGFGKEYAPTMFGQQKPIGGYSYGAGNAGSFERGTFNPVNGYGGL
jgi:hypothetical protein